MNNVRWRLGNNLATRLEELERILNEPLPFTEYCYPICNAEAFFRRQTQYEYAFTGDSDVKLAECLWENLANSEVFEIEGSYTPNPRVVLQYINTFRRGTRKFIWQRQKETYNRQIFQSRGH